MASRMLVSLVFLAALMVVGGLVFLGFWDMPMPRQEIEKPVDVSDVYKERPQN